MELEESVFQTLDYITKYYKKQYSSGTKNWNIDQWNWVESLELNPCT